MQRKRSVKLGGFNTSVSLEDEFWDALKEIAMARGVTVRMLVAEANETRPGVNLSSALRQAALNYYRDLANSALSAEHKCLDQNARHHHRPIGD